MRIIFNFSRIKPYEILTFFLTLLSSILFVVISFMQRKYFFEIFSIILLTAQILILILYFQYRRGKQ